MRSYLLLPLLCLLPAFAGAADKFELRDGDRVVWIGNTLVEPDKTFTVHLSNPQGLVINQNDAVGTIKNDDFGGTLQFASANFPVKENAGTAMITISRTTGDVSLAWDGSSAISRSTTGGSASSGRDVGHRDAAEAGPGDAAGCLDDHVGGGLGGPVGGFGQDA